MISKVSSDPTYDAYYELPEVTYENDEIHEDDIDTGEYVLERMGAKSSHSVEPPCPEKSKPGHKPSVPGVYDYLYDDSNSFQSPVDKNNQSALNDKDGCSKKRKILVACIIGTFSLGVTIIGFAIFLTGIWNFLILQFSNMIL